MPLAAALTIRRRGACGPWPSGAR